MVRLSDDVEQLAVGVAVLLRAAPGEVWQEQEAHDAHDDGEASDRQEGGSELIEDVRQRQADGKTDRRREGEGGGDDADGAPATVFGDQLDDEGHDGRGDDASARAREGSGDEEVHVATGKAAVEGSEGEAGEHDEHDISPVEAVGNEGGEDAGDHGGDAVSGDNIAELGGRDREFLAQLIAERHHDDEIEDVDEVDGREEQN